jgi:hypothetical protein
MHQPCNHQKYLQAFILPPHPSDIRPHHPSLHTTKRQSNRIQRNRPRGTTDRVPFPFHPPCYSPLNKHLRCHPQLHISFPFLEHLSPTRKSVLSSLQLEDTHSSLHPFESSRCADQTPLFLPARPKFHIPARCTKETYHDKSVCLGPTSVLHRQ